MAPPSTKPPCSLWLRRYGVHGFAAFGAYGPRFGDALAVIWSPGHRLGGRRAWVAKWLIGPAGSGSPGSPGCCRGSAVLPRRARRRAFVRRWRSGHLGRLLVRGLVRPAGRLSTDRPRGGCAPVIHGCGDAGLSLGNDSGASSDAPNRRRRWLPRGLVCIRPGNAGRSVHPARHRAARLRMPNPRVAVQMVP